MKLIFEIFNSLCSPFLRLAAGNDVLFDPPQIIDDKLVLGFAFPFGIEDKHVTVSSSGDLLEILAKRAVVNKKTGIHKNFNFRYGHYVKSYDLTRLKYKMCGGFLKITIPKK